MLQHYLLFQIIIYEITYNKYIKTYIGNKINYYNKAATIFNIFLISWIEIFIKSIESLRRKKNAQGQSKVFTIMS